MDNQGFEISIENIIEMSDDDNEQAASLASVSAEAFEQVASPSADLC